MLIINFIWDWVGRFSGLVLGLILTSILSRVLSPSDYGVFSLVFAIIGIATIFIELGFSSAIIQDKHISEEQLSTIFFLNIAIGLSLAVIVFFNAQFISTFYNNKDLILYIRFASIIFIINSFNLVPNALIQKRMLFKQQTIRNLLVTVLVGSLTIYLAFSGWGVWSIIFQTILSALFSLIINWKMSNWLPILILNMQSIKKNIEYSKYLFLSSILNNIYAKIDVFLIGKVFNMNLLGQFNRAQSLDGMTRTVTTSSILAVLFPYFSNNQHDDELILNQWDKFYQLICFTYTLVMGCLYLSANFIFYCLFGPNWLTGAGYFKIICLSGLVFPLSSLALSIIEARGHSLYFFKVEVLKKIIIVPCFLVTYFWGIEEYLWTLIFVFYIALWLNFYFLKQTININIGKSFLNILKSMLIFIIFLICSILIFGFDITNSTNLVTVVLVNILYISFYLSANYFVNKPTFQLTVSIIMNKIKKQ